MAGHEQVLVLDSGPGDRMPCRTLHRSTRIFFHRSLADAVCRRNRSGTLASSLEVLSEEVHMFVTSSLTVQRQTRFAFVLLLSCISLSCAQKESGSATKPLAEHVLKGSLKQTLTGHDESVRSVAFSADGKTVASGGLGNVVKLWNTQTGSLKRTLAETGPPVAFSPQGETLATVDGFKNTIRLWDAATGAEKQTLSGHGGEITSVAFSPDGQTVASSSFDKSVKLWDAKTGTVKQTLSGHSDTVLSVVISADGRTIASGSRDNTIRLWEAQTGALKQTIKTDDIVLAVAFAPKGEVLSSVSGDKTVKLWDAQSGTLKKTLTGEDNLTSAAF